jgi:hypothetical protein
MAECIIAVDQSTDDAVQGPMRLADAWCCLDCEVLFTGLCQNSRHEGEASHVNRSGPDLYGGHYADQLGKSALMGAPALRE